MFRRLTGLILCILSGFGYADCYTQLDAPIYEGGVYWTFRWLYLLPTVSDADLQYATALTLTGPPLTLDETQNLTAHVQQIAPDYTSSYRFNLGYAFPCTNADIDLEYFYFRASDQASVTSPVRNTSTYQFLQNFLGGGYVSSNADDPQLLFFKMSVFRTDNLFDKITTRLKSELMSDLFSDFYKALSCLGASFLRKIDDDLFDRQIRG